MFCCVDVQLCLSIHQLMDIEIVSSLVLLCLTLQPSDLQFLETIHCFLSHGSLVYFQNLQSALFTILFGLLRFSVC